MHTAYALDAPRYLELRSPLVHEDAAAGDIHVAPCGVWLGHPAGPFELTVEIFEQIVANAARLKTPPVLDYEHESEHPTSGKAPAAGWVRGLEVRGTNLWARVEYTDAAAAHVLAGEYRFCSAVFSFSAKDRVTGEPIGAVLKSIALTNTPFIDGQEPIVLSTNSMDSARDQSNNPMVLDESSKPGERRMADQNTDSPEEKRENAADAPPPPPPEEKVENATGPLAALMAATGLDEMALASAIETNLDAVVAALKGGAPDALAPLSQRVAAQDATIRTLSARVAAFESEKAARDKVAEAERRKLIESDLDALGIPADEKPSLVAFALSDRAGFDKLAARLKPGVELGRSHAAKTTKPEVEGVALDDDAVDVKEYRRALKASGISDKTRQDEIIRGRLFALRS